MTYAKLNQLTLPKSAQLSDGRWVSNYNRLPDTILKAEGWLPLEEVRPEYDAATQYLTQESAAEVDGKIVVTYVAVNLPVEINPEPIIEQLEEIAQ